jgi:hypothetical protein
MRHDRFEMHYLVDPKTPGTVIAALGIAIDNQYFGICQAAVGDAMGKAEAGSTGPSDYIVIRYHNGTILYHSSPAQTVDDDEQGD